MDLTLTMDYWHWWILAVTFLIFETVVPGSFFLWMGVAGGIVGLLSLLIPALTFPLQILFFSLISIISAVLWKAYKKRHPDVTDSALLNRRLEQYVGQVFTLSLPLKEGRGRLKIEDTWWAIESSQDLEVGTKVIIESVKDTVLVVTAVPLNN